MKTHKFEVLRRHDGDKEYGPNGPNNERELPAIDAAHLVRAGTLAPKGKEAIDAMAELLGPRENWGVRTVVADAAPGDEAMDANNARAAGDGATPKPAKASRASGTRAKAQGDAPNNKADVTAPAGDTVHAGEPGTEPADAPTATLDTATAGPAATAKPAATKAASGGRSGKRR